MEFIPEHPFYEYQPDTLVAIRKIYNLEDGRMNQSVDILEAWVKKQNHFRNKNFSRVYLEKTIIACKGSVEKAKRQIDKLCTMRTLLPKFFIYNNIKSELGNLNDIVCAVTLPKMTKNYERIFIMKLKNAEFTSSHFLVYYRYILLLTEYVKAHDYCNGFIIIDDFRDANLMEVATKINLVDLQQLMTILTEGYGAKMKGIHIISQSKLVDVFIKTVKSVLSPKLAERVHLHAAIEEMHQLVDKEILPIDYGGNERSIQQLQDEWVELLSSEENEKYLAKMKNSGSDETLRNADKFNEECMGLPGSFRTLTVD